VDTGRHKIRKKLLKKTGKQENTGHTKINGANCCWLERKGVDSLSMIRGGEREVQTKGEEGKNKGYGKSMRGDEEKGR